MKLENIVCSGALNQPVDLVSISKKCNCFMLSKNKYPAAYLHINSHSITIYRTGKYIMPGMKNTEDISDTFFKMIETLTPC